MGRPVLGLTGGRPPTSDWGLGRPVGPPEGRRDVGEGYDEAAIRHPVAADFNHHVAVRQAFQIGLALGGIGPEPPLDQGVAVVRARWPDRSHEFKDLTQGNPDLRHR